MPTHIHPIFSSCAAALIVTACLLELLGAILKRPAVTQAARLNLWIGCIAMVGAFLTGYPASLQASAYFTVPEHHVETHHLWGKAALILAVPCVALSICESFARHNRQAFLWCYRGSLLLLVALVVVTGFFGGELVFSHGAGVRGGVPQALSSNPQQ